MNATHTTELGSGKLHTATKIARAAGLTRQAVYTRMQIASHADAWLFTALPLEWQLAITKRGVTRGFQNGEDFLSSLPDPWRCPLPWVRVDATHQQKAVRLQKALLRSLHLREQGRAGADVESAGLEDFRQEFGYQISARHWRRIFQRTLDRDAGEENWQRLELYLDERALRKPKARAEVAKVEYKHRDLDEVLAAMENRAKPTLSDKCYLWDAVCRHYEELTDVLPDTPAGNRERRLVRASLAQYLFTAFPSGALAATEYSLRRRFEEKLATWRENGRTPEALSDKRPANSGKFGRKLCGECRLLVVGGAVDLDGDLSQAWRRLQLGKQLCKECAGIGTYDVRVRKSEVPKSVRADVTPDILTALPHRRGPKHVRLCSPYVRRSWDDIGPGDWAECDDMTPNHVTHGMVETFTWDTDPDGRPFVGRMEVLFQIDRRTDYPWAYLIILGDPSTAFSAQRKATYNSVHCRLLFLRGHDSLGLPHSGGGFYLENGVWASRLVGGPRITEWEDNPWQRTEMGLRDPRIGLTVRHAQPGNPRSKVIERSFLSTQNRMRCQPGFIGFNERQDKREVMDDFIRRVKAGKEHPGNEVPAVEEFRKLLNAEMMAHAEEPQNGERLPGVSPMEAFHNGIGGRPGIKARALRQLGANARYLLSTHERVMPVTGQGIKYKIGGSEFVFWSPELEPYQHREIITRFNFEEPELLTCQPANGEPFIVKARILPSTTATKEDLQEAAKARASWTRRGKLLYDTLPHPFRVSITRDNEQTVETRATGEFINAEMQAARREASQRKREETIAGRKTTALGLSLNPRMMKNPDKVASAADRIAELKAKIRLQEQKQEQPHE